MLVERQKRRGSTESEWDENGDDDGSDDGATLLEAAAQGEATAVTAGEMLKKKEGRRSKGNHDAKEMKQKLQRRVAGSVT